MTSEEHLPGGQSSSSRTGLGVAAPGLHGQESSWIGLLSVVSRPAMSFLQKYLPGRARTAALSENRAGWIRGDLKTSFVEEEREFLRQLDDMMPLSSTQHAAPHLTYLRYQRDEGASDLLEPGPGLLQPGSGGGTLSWLTVDSLREIGIESAEEMELNLCHQNPIGLLSSVRTVLSHVWLSSMSSQEVKPAGRKDWLTEAVGNPPRGGKSRTWWGSFWGSEENSQRGLLSDVSWAEEPTLTARLCPQQLQPETKAPAGETAAAFVQRTLGENTGLADHKAEPANNGGLQTVQNREWSVPAHQPSSEAAAACSEVTPDQDNGYSSLEEEHLHLSMVKAPSEDRQGTQPTDTIAPEMKAETSEEEGSTSGKEDEEEEAQENEGEAPEATVPTTPQCQNKAIAFIMGCPCSDDDSSSQSNEEPSDDDDGFDSEGSSDLSDSSDEDDDDESSDSDSEADSEAERLWSSLCQSSDPYNPQNFTARLHTSSATPPRTIPAATPPSSSQSTPASSPGTASLPPSSPASSHDAWDDSTSASEADEAESLRLWSSLSCSSDPYSPFNFQAPLRTRGTRAKRTPPRSPHHAAASPPEYRKEEAEERLDSGFSEVSSSSSTRSSSTAKKVRFCDDVEEFFASCGEEEEDRRGPWEELARDRCRFLRRCQEVEQSIAYCLHPQHRSQAYHRLAVFDVQDA